MPTHRCRPPARLLDAQQLLPSAAEAVVLFGLGAEMATEATFDVIEVYDAVPSRAPRLLGRWHTRSHMLARTHTLARTHARTQARAHAHGCARQV